MNLDRALIKTQAKQLIKGKVWPLFLITLVVYILAVGAYSGSSAAKAVEEFKEGGFFSGLKDGISGNSSSSGDLEHYFDGLDDYDSGSGSGENSSGWRTIPDMPKESIKNTVLNYFLNGARIINIVCMPLEIALIGVYLSLIKGNPLKTGEEFSYTFKNTFSKGFFNRWLLMFFQGLFTFLWTLLFIIPGIVYLYKIAFAEYIQVEYPSLSWKECLDLSKKLTNGHKGELFSLDLSFIPWLLLTAVTCGLAQIYAAPYYHTVKALYYENFKQRALQTGEVTQADFMSEEERYAQYVNSAQNQNYNNNYNGYNSYASGGQADYSQQNYNQNGVYTQNYPPQNNYDAQNVYNGQNDYNSYNVQPPQETEIHEVPFEPEQAAPQTAQSEPQPEEPVTIHPNPQFEDDTPDEIQNETYQAEIEPDEPNEPGEPVEAQNAENQTGNESESNSLDTGNSNGENNE